VSDAFNGYNSTVLAYGQTGSGKTHTMFGKGTSYDENDCDGDQGIITRVAKEIFMMVEKKKEEAD